MAKVKLLQGNQACLEGAISAGADFFAGYPITPSSEVAEQAATKFPKLGRKFMQMEDEIASMAAIIGASAVGHKAFTATSGPVFSLMQELLGYAANAELPLVVVNVMRGGPSTGLPTLPAQGDVQQVRWGTHGDHSIIVLSPYSVTEVYYQTIRAFNLAEQYRTPVILLMDEVIGHLRERFDVPEGYQPEIINRKAPESKENYLPFRNTEDGVPPFIALGQGEGSRYHITGLTHGESGFYSSNPQVVDQFIRRLSSKIEDHVDEIAEVEECYTEDAEILLVAYGCSARASRAAVEKLRAQGQKVGLLRLLTLWPFPDKLVAKHCAGKKAVIMPELNLGQMVREVQRVCPSDVPVKSFTKIDGSLFTPEEIINFMKKGGCL